MIGLAWAAAAAVAAGAASNAQPGAWTYQDLGAGADGSKFFLAKVLSEQELVNAAQQKQKATFAVKCDPKGLYVDIVWPETVAGDTYDGTKADVQLKIDNGRTREAKLRKTDMAAMALGKEGFRLLKDLSEAQTLTVRMPDLYGGQTATFHVGGVNALYDRIKAQGCDAVPEPKAEKADKDAGDHRGRRRRGGDQQ